MDVSTLGELLSQRAESDGDALRASGDPVRHYDAARLRTDARKTGNYLKQLGVGPGRLVVIADSGAPESILSLFGAALLGAQVRFVPVSASASEASEIDARVLVGPVDAIDGSPVSAAKRVAYGARPDDPEVAYFERDVWSENPTFPPTDVDASSRALVSSEGEYTHRELLATTERIVENEALAPGVETAVRASLVDPRTVVAGVLAPLACGGVILFPDADTVGDVAVSAGNEGVPEPAVVDVASVTLDGT